MDGLPGPLLDVCLSMTEHQYLCSLRVKQVEAQLEPTVPVKVIPDMKVGLSYAMDLEIH